MNSTTKDLKEEKLLEVLNQQKDAQKTLWIGLSFKQALTRVVL
jgi:hypothetical protein